MGKRITKIVVKSHVFLLDQLRTVERANLVLPPPLNYHLGWRPNTPSPSTTESPAENKSKKILMLGVTVCDRPKKIPFVDLADLASTLSFASF